MAGLALPPPDPGFEIVVSRPGMSQGLAQTDGLQIFPRAFVQLGAVRVGGQWRNLDSATANGVAALFASVARTVGKTQLDATVRYRIKTGAAPGSSPRAWEFSLGARRTFGKFGLRLSADFSPKEFAVGKSLYVEFGPTFDLSRTTRISANIGRREREDEPDYTSFNAGISRVLAKPIALDLRYFRTNRGELGERYHDRIVVSARVAL